MLPRRTGSEASSVRWWRSATNASCSGARERAWAWTLPVATVGHPEPLRQLRRARGCASGRGAGRAAAARRAGGQGRRRPAAAAASARRARRGPRSRSGSTSPAACSSSVSSGTAGGGSCLSRSCTWARVTIRQRLRQPTASSTSSVTCRPSVEVHLRPVDRPQPERLGRHPRTPSSPRPRCGRSPPSPRARPRRRPPPAPSGERRAVQEGEGGVRVELDVGHERMFARGSDRLKTYSARSCRIAGTQSSAIVEAKTSAAASHSASEVPMATAIGPQIAIPTGLKASEPNQS